MLQVSIWSRVLVALVVLTGLLIALPNALPDRALARLPSWLPHNKVSYGLDLQGGSYLLLQVDFDQVQKDKALAMEGDIRAALRKAHILYKDLDANGDMVQVRVTDPARMDEAAKLLDGLNPAMQSSVLSAGAKSYDIAKPGGGLFVLRMTDGFKTFTQTQVMAQSIEVVNRRVNAMGTSEPTVTKSGDDRIVVEVPGLQDPARLKTLLGQTAKMTFQLVDEHADANGSVPPEDEVLQQMSEDPKVRVPPIVVQKRVVVSGDRLTDASQGFSPETNAPIVNFRFDSVGAKQFGDITKAYPPGTQRFAIVLDKQVISAPLINVPILTGSGYIEGRDFTVQSANNLAILMRAGALPAKLKIIQERTVGAELGADSVSAGRLSAIGGLVLVALFMIGRYGLFGLFADIALTLNVVLLLAILTLFGFVLTLPGIAGIVLTMGMAVDANVLIYERIREEQRGGRSMLASIDTGFRRAMSTIIDANMTHVIAALILFELGSGPVKGFAITLGFGIVTSFFTAVMVTRLIVVAWLNTVRPRKLAI